MGYTKTVVGRQKRCTASDRGREKKDKRGREKERERYKEGGRKRGRETKREHCWKKHSHQVPTSAPERVERT